MLDAERVKSELRELYTSSGENRFKNSFSSAGEAQKILQNALDGDDCAQVKMMDFFESDIQKNSNKANRYTELADEFRLMAANNFNINALSFEESVKYGNRSFAKTKEIYRNGKIIGGVDWSRDELEDYRRGEGVFLKDFSGMSIEEARQDMSKFMRDRHQELAPALELCAKSGSAAAAHQLYDHYSKGGFNFIHDKKHAECRNLLYDAKKAEYWFNISKFLDGKGKPELLEEWLLSQDNSSEGLYNIGRALANNQYLRKSYNEKYGDPVREWQPFCDFLIHAADAGSANAAWYYANNREYNAQQRHDPELMQKALYYFDLAEEMGHPNAEARRKIMRKQDPELSASSGADVVSDRYKKKYDDQGRKPIMNTKINIQNELDKCAKRNGTNKCLIIEKFDDELGKISDGSFVLDDLEACLAFWKDYKCSADSSAEDKSVSQFVNQVVVPHLDYFVAKAIKNQLYSPDINMTTYPAICSFGGEVYENSQNLKKKVFDNSAEPTKSIDFSFLRDLNKSTHMGRLEKALYLVNDQVSEFEDVVRELQVNVLRNLEKIQEDESKVESYYDKMSINDKKNEDLREKVHFLKRKDGWTNEAYAAIFTTRDEGTLENLAGNAVYWTKTILGSFNLGPVNIGGMLNPLEENFEFLAKRKRAATERLKLKMTKAQTGAEIAYWTEQIEDNEKILAQIYSVQSSIAEMEKDSHYLAIKKDATKQKAIAEAFVAKYMLLFGKNISKSLTEIAEDYGMQNGVDGLIEHFGVDSCMGEALQNLCFGMADSNDMSIILHSAAAINNPKSTQDKILKELVEDVIKPNIADFYNHASKVDLIYQANLTGMGTVFHDGRALLRGEHDERIKTLFGDAFGVKSDLHELTIVGAKDVKAQFDFYLHRHGDGPLADETQHPEQLRISKYLVWRFVS